MKSGRILAAGLIVCTGATIAALAQISSTEPSDRSARSGLIAPYSMLNSLSSDQKTQIESIHRAELAEEKKLQTKEHDDIMAVLSDAQKKELAEVIAKEQLDRKATSVERRASAEEQRANDLRQAAVNAGASTRP